MGRGDLTDQQWQHYNPCCLPKSQLLVGQLRTIALSLMAFSGCCAPELLGGIYPSTMAPGPR